MTGVYKSSCVQLSKINACVLQYAGLQIKSDPAYLDLPTAQYSLRPPLASNPNCLPPAGERVGGRASSAQGTRNRQTNDKADIVAAGAPGRHSGTVRCLPTSSAVERRLCMMLARSRALRRPCLCTVGSFYCAPRHRVCSRGLASLVGGSQSLPGEGWIRYFLFRHFSEGERSRRERATWRGSSEDAPLFG